MSELRISTSKLGARLVEPYPLLPSSLLATFRFVGADSKAFMDVDFLSVAGRFVVSTEEVARFLVDEGSQLYSTGMYQCTHLKSRSIWTSDRFPCYRAQSPFLSSLSVKIHARVPQAVEIVRLGDDGIEWEVRSGWKGRSGREDGRKDGMMYRRERCEGDVKIWGEARAGTRRTKAVCLSTYCVRSKVSGLSQVRSSENATIRITKPDREHPEISLVQDSTGTSGGGV